jgi:lipid A disaccharide synthetase
VTAPPTDGKAWLVTPRGIRIEVANAGRTAAKANVAVTLPGTNTAELSALGVPMIVTVPTWQAEVAPMPGLAGHIGRLPIVGKYIKRGLGHLILRQIKFMSHPNRRTNRMVVPEIVGHITAGQIADAVIGSLNTDTQRLEEELRSIMGAAGANERLVAGLLAFLQTPDVVRDAAPAR